MAGKIDDDFVPVITSRRGLLEAIKAAKNNQDYAKEDGLPGKITRYGFTRGMRVP